MNRRSGFTLIELTILVGILLILSGAIVPNVVRAQEARKDREFFSNLQRMTGEASVRAVNDKRTVTLSYDPAARTFQTLEEATSDAAEVSVRDLAVPETVDVTTTLNGKDQVAPAEWKLRFYADGKCDKGGVELSYDQDPKSLVIEDNANSRWTTTPLTSDSNEDWPAGDYEHRA